VFVSEPVIILWIAHATLSAAATRTLSRWCTQRLVTDPAACPSIAAIVDSVKPRSPATDANDCLSVCGVRPVVSPEGAELRETITFEEGGGAPGTCAGAWSVELLAMHNSEQPLFR
jgi:hypothetical protein